MLFYGDAEEEVAPAAVLAELRRDDGRWLAHDALRDRFIALSGLTQGIADADFRACGMDRARPAEDVLLDALMTLGGVLMASWDADCAGGIAPAFPVLPDLPPIVTVREAEGYAHYALYPEAYGLAARQLRLDAPPFVLGLRSIGTGLAAIAAAALGAPRPVTLRPGGDPFARSLAIDGDLRHRILGEDRHFVIVDEGPGLSGSSFGCVADWLEDHGVPPHRIAFLPGHQGNLGVEASERHGERWREAQRPVVQPDRLGNWVAGLVGPIDEWRDVSSGGWRTQWSSAEEEWPAVVPGWERMKFLVRSGERRWLVRFAGLSAAGHDKLALARLLEERGFGHETLGLTHGWLVQRWYDEARPAWPSTAELTDYLAIRAGLSAAQGASLAELVAMTRRNLPELAAWDPPVEALQHSVRPVVTDGRLHAHEWLRLPCGRLLKADGLDHHRGHDLIGAQDIAWDEAGAAVELGPVLPSANPRLAAFYRVAYCAFQIGAHELGKGMSPDTEASRHAATVRRYRSALVDAVEHLGDVDQSVRLGIEAFA